MTDNSTSSVDWQPIETAPRDGTPILAFRADKLHRFGHMQVTYWRVEEDGKGYVGWGEFNMTHWPPTHWLPLPKGPADV